MRVLDSTPKADGFYMPSELSPHRSTFILWPERPDNWRLGAKPAQEAFKKVVEAITKHEPVTIGVSPSQYANVLGMHLPMTRVVEMSQNDSWIRDSGATFVVNGKGVLRAVCWGFNGYGGLEDGIYFPWDLDDLNSDEMAELEWVDRYRTPDFILEGGSIHSDGEGTILVTEECLLSKGRNPNMSKDEIEQKLKDYLGAEKVLWIPHGLYADEDTNGHVDNICQFVAPGKVVLAWMEDENDPQHAISQEAYDYLSNETDAKGRKLEIVKIHVPGPLYYTDEEVSTLDVIEGTLPRKGGGRLAASYVNYYNCNGAVILPIFNDPHDQEAIETLQKLFPDKVIETVDSREILLGGGNIHCITQQVPKP